MKRAIQYARAYTSVLKLHGSIIYDYLRRVKHKKHFIYMIKVAIVEDSKKWRQNLKEYLERYGAEKNVGFLTDFFEDGSSFLNSNVEEFDLIFMDIDLAGSSGIEASRELRKRNERASLVFFTELSQFAIQGYEVSAFDFLVKPVAYELFAVKMNRLVRYLGESMVKTFIVKDANGVQRIRYDSILYLESQKHYVYFHLSDGNVVRMRSVLDDVQDEFLSNGFAKINRSIIVSLSKIEGYSRDDIRIGKESLPLSRIYRASFVASLNKFLGHGG